MRLKRIEFSEKFGFLLLIVSYSLQAHGTAVERVFVHSNGSGEAASDLTKFWHVMTPKEKRSLVATETEILPHHHVENLNLSTPRPCLQHP